MRLVTDQEGQRPVIWEWMNRQTHLPWGTDVRTIGLLRDDGSIAAAVAYNSWTPAACFMHVVFDSAHSLTRTFLRSAFSYPFQTVGVAAVYGLTPKDLPEALRFNRKVGFVQIAETVDCVLFEMKRDACRWIKERFDGRKG